MKVRILTLLLPLLLAAFAPPSLAVQLKAGVFAPARVAPPLALASSTGKPFSLQDYRGKVVILEFGYTHCTTVCPVTLAQLAQARTLLGAAGKDVQVVFVTVDPARDDAARLRAWVGQFDPGFIGLTGSQPQLDAVMRAYGISARKIPTEGGGYGMAHSAYLYFIDKKGMLRALMPFGRPAADIAHDAHALLREGE